MRRKAYFKHICVLNIQSEIFKLQGGIDTDAGGIANRVAVLHPDSL